MKPLTVALAQQNFTVGALEANADRILAVGRRAAAAGAGLVVFPELALSGYPPEDLVLKPRFLEACERQLQRLARELPPEIVALVGCPRAAEARRFNTAVVFHGGREVACYRKMVLPNYGVFDEKRLFDPGEKALVLAVNGRRIGVHICEDSWVRSGEACRRLKPQRLDALVNLSASPYHRGKLDLREDILRQAAIFFGAPVLYGNLVGGQDELVFDGASLALDARGRLTARARQFEEDLLFVSLAGKTRRAPGSRREVRTLNLETGVPGTAADAPPTRVEPELEDAAEVYAALTLGLRDYVNKNGFRQVIVSLSGGIDSALVATLAVDALGADRVKGVTMPSQYSSGETLSDAGRLAANLGIELFTLPIQRLYNAFVEELAPVFGARPPDVTEENLQARIRGVLVMALSNKFGWLVLTTGNKSEIATGYCTLYGDMAGGFALIKDVPKTLVYQLAEWRNRRAPDPVIPVSTIERAPSAELRPNQKDSDSLPPYDRLDAILERMVERDEGAADLLAAGFDAATVRRVARLVDRSEYKRRQGAPGLKITPKAFGRDRRMPITNRYDEYEEGAAPA